MINFNLLIIFFYANLYLINLYDHQYSGRAHITGTGIPLVSDAGSIHRIEPGIFLHNRAFPIPSMDHRLDCSRNHTATHILNSVLRNILPNTAQRSSYVGPLSLRLGFTAKSSLTLEQIEEIENTINEIIQKNIPIHRCEMLFEELLNNPKAVILRGEEYPEAVSVISIENSQEYPQILSLEPCCGTHVHNTSDIRKFIVIRSKSHGGSTNYLSAVTGKQASIIEEEGKKVSEKVLQLKKKADEITMVSEETLSGLLKEVKRSLKDCQQMQLAPLITLEKCEKVLQDLKLKLSDMLSSCTISENMISDVTGDKEELCNSKASVSVIQSLQNQNIAVTDDSFKYDWSNEGSEPIEARIVAVIRDDNFVDSVRRGLNCQLVLDKTNFYSEEDDQASDEGVIYCEEFVFKVSNVYKVDGFVFHDGYVEESNVRKEKTVKAVIDQEHRLSCSQNHTALHLLNAVLREELPYAYQQQAHAGSKELFLTFSSKGSLSDLQIENIERKVNEAINMNLDVMRDRISTESLKDFPTYKLPLIKKAKDSVPTVSIGKGNEESVLKSSEPCYGTHVNSTNDIGKFIVISSKAKSNKDKVIRAVTGKRAEMVQADGDIYDQRMHKLQNYVLSCLEKDKLDYIELLDCLKEVKLAKAYHETDLSLLLFRGHQSKLFGISKKLSEVTKDFVQQGFKKVSSEMKTIISQNSDKPYIVHKLQSVGDGKKIINFALENSDNKPAMYFAQDGYKSIICSCSVPKHMVHPSFSALLWINPVASLLEGRARTLTKDPELHYSVVCSETVDIDKAIDVAKQFVESHLN